MTTSIRDRIEDATKNAKSQSDMDALVAGGLLRTLVAEGYPADEIMYEWDSRKLHFRKMTRGDDDGY
jgi:hypothetical protein